SPTIFAELFKIFGEKGEYSIMDITPDKLSDIREICKDVVGFNVTKPFKTEIIKYLSCDKSECGSVNTVTVSDMTGYSTDGAGFLFDLERNFDGASSSNVLILGYGGAASACVSALVKRGANVAVTGRSVQKVTAFADRFGVKVYNDTFKPDGIVSCVTETYLPPIDLSGIKFCYDLRYAGQTLEVNCPSANGLGMLIAQAIYSYGIFTGKQFDNDEVKRVYLKLKEIL
ncbi:MAG: hypothetical protein J1F36_02710, partial [Clostridiales bacterium]|nr:hypothetical protein [Clostridiales bacterium]